MRSFTFPKLSNASIPSEHAYHRGADSAPTMDSPTHSRCSSGESMTSSPITPTFSNRTTSSLATSVDSPVNLAKSELDDLVEDPAEDPVERDDSLFDVASFGADEPLCICDTPFCEHQQASSNPDISMSSPNSPEWRPGDDALDTTKTITSPSLSRYTSDEQWTGTEFTKRHRHWPSISRKWRDRKATTSISSPTIRSAPASRPSSIRIPSLRASLVNHLDPREPTTPPATPGASTSGTRSRTTSLSRVRTPPQPLDIVKALETEPVPVERDELASTPLLPPLMAEMEERSSDQVASPLQSPTLPSTTSAVASVVNSPTFAAVSTPILSAKPSFTSIGGYARTSNHGFHSSSVDVHPNTAANLITQIESDYWADRLGHANFHIFPEPYLPESSDTISCQRLLLDWERARVEYMKQAARIREHYGPTSTTYHDTEAKWAEIDQVWRANLDVANARATANGQAPALQSLAETTVPVGKLPALNDPEQPAKFPAISEADIVGPMVQYAKIPKKSHTTPVRTSRKPVLLRLFTDPVSLFGGRSA